MIGKAIPPDPNAAIPWAGNIVNLSLKVATPNAPRQPVPGDFSSAAALQAALQAFVEQS